LSLADAIAYSDNTACVQALLHIGLDSFKEVLIDYGIIDCKQKITPSIILGSSMEGIGLAECFSKCFPNVVFGGRLAEYKYYDMDKVIKSALDRVQSLLNW